MTLNLLNLTNLERSIRADGAILPLNSTVALLEALVGPLSHNTPEERALTLAVEMQDGMVAGQTMERVIARKWNEIPLSVKALWLKVAKSLRAEDGGATRNLLLQITAYFR